MKLMNIQITKINIHKKNSFIQSTFWDSSQEKQQKVLPKNIESYCFFWNDNIKMIQESSMWKFYRDLVSGLK